MKYNIHLQGYEGPLDLLYDLITRQKIDIKDISIFEITNQYISYLDTMGKMDLEITSDFITMACKLLEIKSKYLLYKQRQDEVEEDPRKELMEKLVEYRKFKNASQFLKDRVDYSVDIFYRKKEEVLIDDKPDLSNLTLDDLINILPKIIKVEKNQEIKDENLKKIYKAPIISIEQKINYIRFIINKEDKIPFKNLIKKENKDEIIATFLSMLELIKNKEIEIVQENFFEDIILKKKKE
jgi:segregation and condensation protein A